ncbi:hypothetical protein PG994_014436 [Apiospora phragmitis]|uniref:Uncharacterized protein n=1 Tax=Apiospora phragmitis TaxID=2905665 RepID=A0ABR1T4C8_9PEZI
MLQSLRNKIWFLNRWLGLKRNPDGSWNEVQLQISEWGLHIQKDVLHIPYKYGLFFPGPPQLRTSEAIDFLFLTFGLTSLFILSVILILTCRYDGRPPVSWAVHALLLGTMVGDFLVIWVTLCLSEMRSPDHKWPESKIRLE